MESISLILWVSTIDDLIMMMDEMPIRIFLCGAGVLTRLDVIRRMMTSAPHKECQHSPVLERLGVPKTWVNNLLSRQ